LIDQIANTLKRARAINTSATNPNFQSAENPMGVTEDLFLPLPDTDDLAIDKIGGEPDIRWIVDIDELKQQLACALSTPLSLLGGYVGEATGALGSDAIEKLDIGFARNARRLQRSLINGIKRLCQIHLAYQNLDPDPAMFEVCMSSPSTAEEESLRNALETGTNTIQTFMDMIEGIDPNLDKKDIFKYLNQKILKLEDFDLSNFQKGITPLGEEKQEEGFVRYPIKDTDLISYLPLHTVKINEKKTLKPKLTERSSLLFHNRWMGDWDQFYGEALIFEGKGGETPQVQLTLEEEEKRRKQAQEAELQNPI